MHSLIHTRYMLFLLNGDVPCTKASWVQLTL